VKIGNKIEGYGNAALRDYSNPMGGFVVNAVALEAGKTIEGRLYEAGQPFHCDDNECVIPSQENTELPLWNEACSKAVQDHYKAGKATAAESLRIPDGVFAVCDGNRPEDATAKFKDTLQKVWNEGDPDKPLLTALTEVMQDIAYENEKKVVREAIDHIKEVEQRSEAWKFECNEWERRFHALQRDMDGTMQQYRKLQDENHQLRATIVNMTKEPK
jgi:hypothetical protein